MVETANSSHFRSFIIYIFYHKLIKLPSKICFSKQIKAAIRIVIRIQSKYIYVVANYACRELMIVN